MKPFVIEVGTNFAAWGSTVTGRNGTHNLAAIYIERHPSGNMVIGGIGKSGRTLNAGFFLAKHDADNFLRELKNAGIIA
jgi:hypothetical protein